MTARAYELSKSRALRFDANNPGTSLEYIVLGAADRDDIAATAQLLAPYTTLGFTRLSWSADPLGGGVWTLSIPYGVPKPGDPPALFPGETAPDGFPSVDPSFPDMTNPGPEGSPWDDNDPFTGTYPEDGSGGGTQQTQTATGPLGPEWAFSTTGGTRKITHALTATARGGLATRYIGRGVIPPTDYKGAIGVKKSDGKYEVEGFEVPDPKLDFTTTRNVAAVSFKYVRTIALLTGSVNKTDFGNFKAGELLFLGADGQYKPPSGQQENGGWAITFKFAANPNIGPFAAAFELASGIDLPIGEVKEGWDLLDVMYEDTPTSGRLLPIPSQVAIHRIFPRADFRYLGFDKYAF